MEVKSIYTDYCAKDRINRPVEPAQTLKKLIQQAHNRVRKVVNPARVK